MPASNNISRRRVLHGALAAPSLAQLSSAASSAAPSPLRAPLRAEVVVYGATPGGIMAAVSAARLGHSVLLCEYEGHIGGIVSNGLTNADIGKRQAVGGLFYEFTRRVLKRYQDQDRNDPAQPNVNLCHGGYWYEATAAEEIFHQMISEQNGRIRLLLNHELKLAAVKDNRLSTITLEDRNHPGRSTTVAAPVFIDATYEGDLAAMAGVPFRTGREGRAEYNEPHAGRIYMRFRDSQLLPGSTGEADNATQAYCFRFHVTNDPAKRVPIAKPGGYNRDDYTVLLDDIRAGNIKRFRDVIQVYPMPNGRFELNSDHVNPNTGYPKESLDLAEECWPWPTATPAQRRLIYQRYKTHNVGMIWLLQNDPELPEALRADSRQYGWHRDLWPNNGHIARQVYVRQGRRILGDYIVTERDADLDPALQRTKVQPTSIATIEWAFDPHAHHKYDPAHPGVREGYFFVDHEPFQFPYEALVPRNIEALLVPVACSCSHVAYNAVRMEPVFMVLGEACGAAAHLALKLKTEVRKIPARQLQKILVEQKGVITFYEDLPFTDPSFPALQWLGARGLNPGYTAALDSKLNRAAAAERLARVLQFEGRSWQPPTSEPNLPLTSSSAHDWLRQAGYKPPQPANPTAELTLGAFAQLLYATLA